MNNALETLLAALKKHPDDVETLFLLGKEYRDQGQFEEAKSYLLQALDKHPSHTRAVCTLMSLYFDFACYTDAIDLFKSKYDFFEQNKEAKLSLLNALNAIFMLHNMNLGPFGEASAVEHNYQEMFFNIGKIFFNLGCTQKAARVLESAYLLNKENTRLNLILTQCYIMLDRLSDAEILIKDLKQRYPEDEDVSILIAHKLLKEENYEEAKAVLHERPMSPRVRAALDVVQYYETC